MTTPGPARCGGCGRAADEPPLTWSSQRAAAGAAPQWLCEECTRRHVRSIEARLDDAWW